MTTQISVRATVLYPAGVYPHLDQWAKYVALCFGGEFSASGLDRDHRDLVFDFASADRIGAFIAAIESNPGCSVMIGKPPVLAREAC